MPESVPAGYTQQRERGAIIVALPSVMASAVAALLAAPTLYDWAAAQPGAQPFTGRGAAYRVHVNATDWLVRHYRRGGFVARLSHDRYLRAGTPRPLHELAVSAQARAAGVPTPEVLAAIVYPGRLTYRGDLVTRYISHSADLAAVSFGTERWSDAPRVAAWHAAGTLLRRSFAAGLQHADLNLRNILITHDQSQLSALLLDLDRARISVVDDVAQRSMLARLHRSRRKLERAAGATVGTAELAAFDRALHASASELH